MNSPPQMVNKMNAGTLPFPNQRKEFFYHHYHKIKIDLQLSTTGTALPLCPPSHIRARILAGLAWVSECGKSCKDALPPPLQCSVRLRRVCQESDAKQVEGPHAALFQQVIYLSQSPERDQPKQPLTAQPPRILSLQVVSTSPSRALSTTLGETLVGGKGVQAKP